jgi:hypothetical protein
MIYIYVTHRVEDYNKWKPFFDDDEAARKSYGVELKKLFRSVEDTNDIHLLFEAPDEKSAQLCIERPELKQIMQQAGVISEPVFKVLQIA